MYGPFLVEFWYTRLYHEQEARRLAHQQRMVSQEIMSTYNRPQSVINLQALRDRVYALMGAK
jgi:hypothetical protein